jgi:hypothetical protein
MFPTLSFAPQIRLSTQRSVGNLVEALKIGGERKAIKALQRGQAKLPCVVLRSALFVSLNLSLPPPSS